MVPGYRISGGGRGGGGQALNESHSEKVSELSEYNPPLRHESETWGTFIRIFDFRILSGNLFGDEIHVTR